MLAASTRCLNRPEWNETDTRTTVLYKGVEVLIEPSGLKLQRLRDCGFICLVLIEPEWN
jgi:hypothetical protein